MEKSGKKVFFAIVPDKSTREALRKIQAELSECLTPAIRRRARAVREENLHMTLAFLGWLTDIECQQAMGINIDAQGLEITLAQVGRFRRNKIVWAGMTQPADELSALQRQVTQQLGAIGIAQESGSWIPHVTLYRKLEQVPEVSFAIHWSITEIRLLESKATDRGVRYETLQRWQL